MVQELTLQGVGGNRGFLRRRVKSTFLSGSGAASEKEDKEKAQWNRRWRRHGKLPDGGSESGR